MKRDKKNFLPETDALIVSLSDYSSDLEEGVREVFDCPYNIEIVNIYANAIGTPAGNITIDIIRRNVSIFTTKLIIDGQTNSSKDSATPFKLNQYTVDKGDRLTFIIDDLATVVPGSGLKVYIEYYKLYK